MVGAESGLTIQGSLDMPENGTPTNEHGPNHRRVRACIACRNMKIKCVSVPGSKDCETCLRFSRPCQDPGPPKARVKTSQKFSELERKIDALTSALDAERRRNQQSLKQVRAEAQWSKTPDSNIREDDDIQSLAERQDQDSELAANDGRLDLTVCGNVIDQGLVDTTTASLFFDHWNVHMRPFMPVVQFSVGEDAHTIQAEKPTLFLTIMTIASTSIRPSLVPQLLTRLNNTLAQEVFIQGGKSLDLLQSLILFSQYYVQPPHIKAFALPQHIYSAVVMCHDLGLSTITKPNEGNMKDVREAYRTSLAVYFGASCAATLLRRHQPLMFTSSHRECIQALTQAHDGLNDDQWLCSLVVLQEIFDDVSKTLNASYTSTDESFDDFRTQHLLGIFRQRLTDWKLSPSGDVDPRLKAHAASIADLYIHQVAIRVYIRQMHTWLNAKDKYGTGSQSPPKFTPTHTDALCHCLKAGIDVLNIYISLEDTLLRSLPNVFLIWDLCAAVCVIKLGHFAEDLRYSRSSDRDYYNLPSPSDLLDAMIKKLTHLSSNGYFPQSRPFLIAFKKLNTWFQQKKTICINNNGTCEEEGSGPIHAVLGTQTPPASPSATPPPQARIGDEMHLRNHPELEPERAGPVALPDFQFTGQQSLEWDPNTHLFSRTKTLTDEAIAANATFNAAYDPGYFNTDLGNLGSGFDDMKVIEDFMMQTSDEGLWPLL
ncbi:hypothetical protein F4776DRAFT_662634 [Hypoxylon sp. NC0597]|nr:hypothetical protein F4776DRAFT_662634 [Hypoxylon sp. NC0597]